MADSPAISRRANAPGLPVFASQARTADPTPSVFSMRKRAMELIIDCTIRTAASSVTFNVEKQDPASGKWILLLASAAVAAVSTVRLRISPHLTAAANLVAADHATGNLRVRPVHANADSITYSVGAIPQE